MRRAPCLGTCIACGKNYVVATLDSVAESLDTALEETGSQDPVAAAAFLSQRVRRILALISGRCSTCFDASLRSRRAA